MCFMVQTWKRFQKTSSLKLLPIAILLFPKVDACVLALDTFLNPFYFSETLKALDLIRGQVIWVFLLVRLARISTMRPWAILILPLLQHASSDPRSRGKIKDSPLGISCTACAVHLHVLVCRDRSHCSMGNGGMVVGPLRALLMPLHCLSLSGCESNGEAGVIDHKNSIAPTGVEFQSLRDSKQSTDKTLLLRPSHVSLCIEIKEEILNQDNTYRRKLTDQVVSTALPKSQRALDKYLLMIKGLMTTDQSCEFIKFPERMVLQNFAFSGGLTLQNLIVQSYSYANELDNFGGLANW
ncbi:hypothetical protein VNO77_44770 [Canavalia gladiata]|uniref:Uncharacterized protein n=1 Tax=Canavalia gladiata TaxID=3824 RepID=A0AAN9JZ15_CANGL